jgi:hypothetical protein
MFVAMWLWLAAMTWRAARGTTGGRFIEPPTAGG